MNRVRVKICGITRADDRDVVIAAGADALGFIVDVPVETPREISPEEAATLAAGLPPFVTSVLVTMPDSVAAAVTLQERVGTDAIQVHSGLSPGELVELRDRVDAAIIAAVDAHDDAIDDYAGAADLLLVDSTTADGAGGTGETHDWTTTRAIVERVDTPVALAGGLSPENVREAIQTVGPFAVDTASGVERAGGRKDPEAVRAFVDVSREVST